MDRVRVVAGSLALLSKADRKWILDRLDPADRKRIEKAMLLDGSTDGAVQQLKRALRVPASRMDATSDAGPVQGLLEDAPPAIRDALSGALDANFSGAECRNASDASPVKAAARSAMIRHMPKVMGSQSSGGDSDADPAIQ